MVLETVAVNSLNLEQELRKCWGKRPGRITLKMPVHSQKASLY